LAVGGTCANSECGGLDAWTSVDGHTWHAAGGIAPGGGALPVTTTVAAGPSGWLAGGETFGTNASDPRTPSVWTTPDGSTWVAASIATDPGSSGSVSGIAVAGARYVAVGAVSSDTAHVAAAWTSADGATWTRAPDSPALAGGVMSAVVATAIGFVAVGRDDTGAAAWVSTDGTSWDKATAGPGFAGARMASVAASSGRLVAVGYDGTGALAWSSTDGRTWSQMQAAASMAGSQAVGVASGSTLDVAVGGVTGNAQMWTATH
jgi:hypothetical protein